jgi:cobalt-zinc-cadmium resistance protein CzcA
MKKNRLQSHHRDWRRFFLVEMGVVAGVQRHLATVVGGVFTSTLLTLFLLPILYLLFHRRGKT